MSHKYGRELIFSDVISLGFRFLMWNSSECWMSSTVVMNAWPHFSHMNSLRAAFWLYKARKWFAVYLQKKNSKLWIGQIRSSSYPKHFTYARTIFPPFRISPGIHGTQIAFSNWSVSRVHTLVTGIQIVDAAKSPSTWCYWCCTRCIGSPRLNHDLTHAPAEPFRCRTKNRRIRIEASSPAQSPRIDQRKDRCHSELSLDARARRPNHWTIDGNRHISSPPIDSRLWHLALVGYPMPICMSNRHFCAFPCAASDPMHAHTIVCIFCTHNVPHFCLDQLLMSSSRWPTHPLMWMLRRLLRNFRAKLFPIFGCCFAAADASNFDPIISFCPFRRIWIVFVDRTGNDDHGTWPMGIPYHNFRISCVRAMFSRHPMTIVVTHYLHTQTKTIEKN